MDDSARVVIALTNRLVDAGTTPLRASEFWEAHSRLGDLDDLESRLDELDDRLAGSKVAPDRVRRLLDSGVSLAVRLETLAERGLWIVTATDEEYPHRLIDRLGPAAPPLFYGAGERSLLAVNGIGVVGSRDVDEEGAEVARDVARAAVRRRLPVVSGGARGVDQLAMGAAELAGGTAVGVLADSLEKAVSRGETRRALADGNVCLITPYKPDAGFSAGNAMGRNKLIYGLSRITVVVASARDSGGTWAGATEALSKRYGSVAVWRGPGEGPGNAELEKLGATPITDISTVATPDAAPPRPVGSAEQLSLLGGNQ